MTQEQKQPQLTAAGRELQDVLDLLARQKCRACGVVLCQARPSRLPLATPNP